MIQFSFDRPYLMFFGTNLAWALYRKRLKVFPEESQTDATQAE